MIKKHTNILILFLIISLILNIKLYFDYQQLKEIKPYFGYQQIKETKTVDYTIYPASLPANELLRVQEAKELYSIAFNSGSFFAVSNVDSLIKLIQHAWQWDKNAMLYYYDILDKADLYDSNYKEDYMISFDEFMSKYRDKLVDRYGRPLEEPGIFKHPDFRNYFDKKMTELEYPYFANQWGLSLGTAGWDDNGLLRNTTDENLEKSIHYLTIGINNGYHDYETLMGRILFQSGENFKYHMTFPFRSPPTDPLNKLTAYRKSITPEQLKLAIDYAHVMAEHGSILGMFRVSEAYFYGLGRERDEIKAYTWALLMDFTYQEHKDTQDFFEYVDKVMPYQSELKARLEKTLTEEQKQTSQHLLSQLKASIVNWNYDRWRNQIDDFEPRP